MTSLRSVGWRWGRRRSTVLHPDKGRRCLMAELPTSDQVLLEEWKEARSFIGQSDEYLLNLRRYGFALATILIGTDACLSTSMNIRRGQKLPPP